MSLDSICSSLIHVPEGVCDWNRKSEIQAILTVQVSKMLGKGIEHPLGLG